MFVDSHAHLDGERFDADRDQVIARAHDSGVQTIVAIGTGDGPGTLDSAIKVAEKYQGIYATVGIHPHEASLASEADFEQLETLAKSPKVIAWGEIGLDYFYDHSPREIQQQVFIRQMQMARAAKLPIVIHCRPSENSENAWEDCLALIDQHWKSGGMGGVLHCFTGSWAHAKRALDMGFTGIVSFPKADNVRAALRVVPLARLLIETDSPYLAPLPYRGRRNEPAFVLETARRIGQLRGLSLEKVGQQTSANFYEFFNLTERAENKVLHR